LSVVPQNRRREVGAGHASRSSSLLSVEASLARVSQSGLKTGGCVTMCGACGTIAGRVGGKLKLDGSMRRAASDPTTLALPFSFYYATGA
jgi:hypothetical protein